ncbi:hypothetical protein Slin15195_G120820 [Septoria linicola]|uniref:Cell wall protein PhiA n=1 Tax=Septoria linicola TaxID=215465 RepID=A0A9Q9B4G3_9PEZI|nr:hypothetical protein Slin15195_G120820 [Septoria linicola]
MQYPTLALLGMASTALALPQVGVSGAPKFGDAFGLEASADSISQLYNQVTATRGRIYVGGEQSPVCELGTRADFATFVWYSDKTVYLYKTDNPPQQLWVDASGMGQGISGYETVGQNTKPRNAGTEGFEVDEAGVLTFQGASPKACPVEAGIWSIWFSGSDTPGNQDGCVPMTLTAYKTPHRVACTYSDPVNV